MAYPTRTIGTTTAYPTWISNPEVNSAAIIDLKASRFAKSIEVFTSVRDTSASSVSDTFVNKLSRGINSGFANPLYTVQCLVDLTASHTTGSGCDIDWEHYQNLINRSDQYMTLYDRSLITTANTAGTAKVMLKNYSDTRTVDDSKEGYMMKCTLSFAEVR